MALQNYGIIKKLIERRNLYQERWPQLKMCLRKIRQAAAKMMLLLWTSKLDISALEVKGHWATLEELLKAVGRYLLCYESVLKSCKDKVSDVLQLYMSFATKC